MLPFSTDRAILYFFIYSFVGWVCESIYCSIGNRKIINRGFLNGPVCPVYGFGGLLILILAAPFAQYPPLVFIITLIACGVLEYFTGWLLETAFQTRWWDYSNYRFNIKGRVCLLNLMLFGIMGLGMLYFVQPLVSSLLNKLSGSAEQIISVLLLAVLAIDLVYTVSSIIHLRDRLHKLQTLLAKLEEYDEKHSWYDKKDIHASIERLRVISEESGSENDAEILAKIDKITANKGRGRRLINAFPNANFKGFGQAIEDVRIKWNEEKEKLEKKK